MQNPNGYISKILLRDFLPPISRSKGSMRTPNGTIKYPDKIVLSSKNKYAVSSDTFDIAQRLDPIEIKINCEDEKVQRRLSKALKECMKNNLFIELETGVLSKGGNDNAYRKKTFSAKTMLNANDLVERIEDIAKNPINDKFTPSKTGVQGYTIHGFDTEYSLIEYTLNPNSYDDKHQLEIITENLIFEDEELVSTMMVSFIVKSDNADDVNTLCNKLNDLSMKKESFVNVTGHLPRQNLDHYVVEVNESCSDLIGKLQKVTKVAVDSKK